MRPIAILYENLAWMTPLPGAFDDARAPHECAQVGKPERVLA